MHTVPLLEQQQENLLAAFVEAFRNVPLDQRQPFHMTTSDESYFAEVEHSGLPDKKISAYKADIRVLERKGLLDVSYSEFGIVYGFDLTPEAFAHYRQAKQRDDRPVQRIESNLRSYLLTDRFQQSYYSAYQRWKDAEALLW